MLRPYLFWGQIAIQAPRKLRGGIVCDPSPALVGRVQFVGFQVFPEKASHGSVISHPIRLFGY